MNKKDIEKAITRLEQLKELALAPNKKFDLCINLARWNYEIGNLDSAFKYTNLAKSIAPNTVQVHLNLGFFAILNENAEEFCENFKRLHDLRNDPVINWVDVVDFQYNQLEKYPTKEKFFNFSIAFIGYVFIDEGNKQNFENVVSKFESNKQLECLYKFGKYVLSQPYIKQTFIGPRKQKGKGKGGRRKRRY